MEDFKDAFFKKLEKTDEWIMQVNEFVNQVEEDVTSGRAEVTQGIEVLDKMGNAIGDAHASIAMLGMLAGIGSDHEKVKPFIRKIDATIKRIIQVSNKIAPLGGAQETPKEKENLGPLSEEFKMPSKEELEDELFKLVGEKNEAVSQKEKEEIQKKIDRVHKILTSSLKK